MALYVIYECDELMEEELDECNLQVDILNEQSIYSTSKTVCEIFLAQHQVLQTGHKHNQCDSCNNQFTSKDSLLIHQRKHNGEKPFKCEYCVMCFAYRTNLIVHQRTHSGYKPYNCK